VKTGGASANFSPTILCVDVRGVTLKAGCKNCQKRTAFIYLRRISAREKRLLAANVDHQQKLFLATWTLGLMARQIQSHSAPAS